MFMTFEVFLNKNKKGYLKILFKENLIVVSLSELISRFFLRKRVLL